MTTISGFSGDALQAYYLLGVSSIFAKAQFSCVVSEIVTSNTTSSQAIFVEAQCDYLRIFNWNDIFVYNLTPDSLWHAFREVIDGAAEHKL